MAGILVILSGCSGKTYELVLIHTNDHHGSILPHDGRGGLAERATFINQVRAENPHVLVLDAGDLNTGTAFSNMFAAEPDILAYNLMAYDAVTFGNHEFNAGQEKLEHQIALAEFPFVSSNITLPDGTFFGGHQYVVRDFNSFKVGIFGITTLRTLTISGPESFVTTLTFIPEIEAARVAVDLLRGRERVDIVIALTHIGDVQENPDHITSPMLAAAVPGIDIIVDGHSHSIFDAPVREGNTWIVTAGEWGKYAGMGRLSITRRKPDTFDWELVDINERFTPDAAVTALITPYKELADASLSEVIGEAADTFIFGNRLPRYTETAIGNMICDANRWYLHNVFNQNIDFVFHNGGNIRAQLPQGELTREQILTVLPFENYVHIASLSGEELIELFTFIASIPQGNGGFPQFSREVRYTLDVSARSIYNLTIGGEPVDPGRIYRFATNDFLMGGGDGYTILTRARDPYNTSLLLSYVVMEYIRLHDGAISPATDGRMVVVNF